jgi:hypothetical protein
MARRCFGEVPKASAVLGAAFPLRRQRLKKPRASMIAEQLSSRCDREDRTAYLSGPNNFSTASTTVPLKLASQYLMTFSAFDFS